MPDVPSPSAEDQKLADRLRPSWAQPVRFDYSSTVTEPEPVPRDHPGVRVGAFGDRVQCRTCATICLPNRNLRAWVSSWPPSSSGLHGYPFERNPGDVNGAAGATWDLLMPGWRDMDWDDLPGALAAYVRPGGSVIEAPELPQLSQPAQETSGPSPSDAPGPAPEPETAEVPPESSPEPSRPGPQAQRAALGLDKYPHRTPTSPSRSKEARHREYERRVRRGKGPNVGKGGSASSRSVLEDESSSVAGTTGG